MDWDAKTQLFKHDRPVDAWYFVTSAMRQSVDRLAPWGASPLADSAKEGWYYDEFGISFAGGQLAFAAPERRQFGPSVDVEAVQEDINARITENWPTRTDVGAGESSGCVARSSCGAI